jgi:Tfp pilus assembly protein PilF
MIADHPWLGCGPGNFQEAYTRYKLPEASEEVADPHDFLLEVWATAGTPAAVALLAVLGLFAWRTGWHALGRRPGADAQEGSALDGEGRGVLRAVCHWLCQCLGACTGGASGTQSFGSEDHALRSSGRATERGVPPLGDEPAAGVSSGCEKFILAGAVGGFLLAVPLGRMSAAPPGPAVTLLGLPVAVACLVLLRGWVRDGRLPVELPAIGVAVLLVDLLTTGGISLPAVAGTFWLLLALGVYDCREDQPSRPGGARRPMLRIGARRPTLQTEPAPLDQPRTQLPSPRPSPERRGGPDALPTPDTRHPTPSSLSTLHSPLPTPHTLLPAPAWAGLIAALALAVACYATAYAPVLRCQGFLRRAWRNVADGRLVAAREDLERAAEADPWSPQPHVELAAAALEEWWSRLDEPSYARFERHDASARRLSPQSAVLWLTSGDQYTRAFSRKDGAGRRLRPCAIDKAVESYRRAVELYPNDALGHARLALAYRAAGDETAAGRQAEIALDLDRRTPHADKKLPDAVRQSLKR